MRCAVRIAPGGGIGSNYLIFSLSFTRSVSSTLARSLARSLPPSLTTHTHTHTLARFGRKGLSNELVKRAPSGKRAPPRLRPADGADLALRVPARTRKLRVPGRRSGTGPRAAAQVKRRLGCRRAKAARRSRIRVPGPTPSPACQSRCSSSAGRRVGARLCGSGAGAGDIGHSRAGAGALVAGGPRPADRHGQRRPPATVTPDLRDWDNFGALGLPVAWGPCRSHGHNSAVQVST